MSPGRRPEASSLAVQRYVCATRVCMGTSLRVRLSRDALHGRRCVEMRAFPYMSTWTHKATSARVRPLAGGRRCTTSTCSATSTRACTCLAAGRSVVVALRDRRARTRELTAGRPLSYGVVLAAAKWLLTVGQRCSIVIRFS